MTGRRIFASLLACASVVVLVAAPTASAKPGYSVFPGFRSIGFVLHGSNGYRIEIGKQSDGYAYVFVSKKLNAVSYSTRSLAPKGDGIKARFPGVGRVAVRFRPQGPPRKSESDHFPGCRGGITIRQPGHFIGTIRFRGEQGYTSAQATRVKGQIETFTKEVCKLSPSDDSGSLADETELWAYSQSGTRGVAFDAHMLGDPFNLTSFGAALVERRRGMTIFRTTNVTGKNNDITIDDTRPYPLSATVTPPAPFSGSAEYKRTPGGDRTWTGSLAVSFPGTGPVALTGPDFDARLCQLSGCSGSSIDGLSLPLIASAHDRRAP